MQNRNTVSFSFSWGNRAQTLQGPAQLAASIRRERLRKRQRLRI
jgi:hypothetical protein